MEYIVTADPREAFDCNGKSLGMCGKRVVCYASSIGRRRYYRQYMDNIDSGMKILSFKRKKSAQDCLDTIIEIDGDKRKIEEINSLA